MNVTFRQLRVFEAVARHLSFTRAAEELYLTQPAVSMQVKQMEGAVGLPLFEQMGRRIHLTEAGRDLRDDAANVPPALISRLQLSSDELLTAQRLLRDIVARLHRGTP